MTRMVAEGMDVAALGVGTGERRMSLKFPSHEVKARYSPACMATYDHRNVCTISS